MLSTIDVCKSKSFSLGKRQESRLCEVSAEGLQLQLQLHAP